MSLSKQSKQRLLIVLGGIGFGAYFTFGLSYFETFGLADQVGLAFFLPIFALLAIVSITLGLFLFGNFSKQKLIMVNLWAPLVGLALSVGLIYLYASSVLETPKAPDLLSKIATHLSLIGLLPSIAALILIPKEDVFANRTSKNNAVPNSGSENSDENSENPPAKAFDILLKDLIVIEAADNYCKFTFLSNGQIKTQMQRMRMKEAEQALEKHPQFMRCHRSFLVNAEMILAIQGNAQAYRLELRYLDGDIPVSRAFDVEPLKAMLKH